MKVMVMVKSTGADESKIVPTRELSVGGGSA